MVENNAEGDDDNLLIFHFTSLHASEECATHKEDVFLCGQKVMQSRKDDFLCFWGGRQKTKVH